MFSEGRGADGIPGTTKTPLASRRGSQNCASALLDGRISHGVCGLPGDHFISKFPDVIGVYHQAVGWGGRSHRGPGALVASPPQTLEARLLVFVVFGLAAATLSAGHVQSLVRIQFSPTPRPINSWCLQSAHVYARFILLETFVVLVALAWMSGAARSDGLHWGWGRDLARRRRPPIRHIPADVLTLSGWAAPLSA